MSAPIATADQQAACAKLGESLLEQVRAFIVRHAFVRGPMTDERLSQEAGRLLVMAVYAAANDVEWLNRVYATQGIGVALGETFGQLPQTKAGLLTRLAEGMAAGERWAGETFQARGQA